MSNKTEHVSISAYLVERMRIVFLVKQDHRQLHNKIVKEFVLKLHVYMFPFIRVYCFFPIVT